MFVYSAKSTGNRSYSQLAQSRVIAYIIGLVRHGRREWSAGVGEGKDIVMGDVFAAARCHMHHGTSRTVKLRLGTRQLVYQ